jgi:hypothetical protein
MSADLYEGNRFGTPRMSSNESATEAAIRAILIEHFENCENPHWSIYRICRVLEVPTALTCEAVPFRAHVTEKGKPKEEAKLSW